MKLYKLPTATNTHRVCRTWSSAHLWKAIFVKFHDRAPACWWLRTLTGLSMIKQDQRIWVTRANSTALSCNTCRSNLARYVTLEADWHYTSPIYRPHVYASLGLGVRGDGWWKANDNETRHELRYKLQVRVGIKPCTACIRALMASTGRQAGMVWLLSSGRYPGCLLFM